MKMSDPLKQLTNDPTFLELLSDINRILSTIGEIKTDNWAKIREQPDEQLKMLLMRIDPLNTAVAQLCTRIKVSSSITLKIRMQHSHAIAKFVPGHHNRG